MSVEITNISKSFGDLKALHEISFDIKEGEIFGLIGPDGAGKTTLFRIIATLLLADQGTVKVKGLEVKEAFRKIRRIIGYMAGRFSLYMDLTVKENLEFYATVFGTTIQTNYDLIKDVYSQIEPFEDRLAGKLSGGMKQKLALSCALIHRPKVLILDEPTTGVDAVSRQEFWDMLHKIRKEGITVLVSTPYMDEAVLCDRVGLLQKGRLLSVSNPTQLTLKDGTRLFRFMSSRRNYEYLEKIRSTAEGIDAWLFGDEIHVFINTDEDLLELQAAMQDWRVPGLNWEEKEPGVEDFFMQLLSKEESN